MNLASPAAARTFLGFDGAFVPAVARALLAEHGKSLGGRVVVVPGRRAGRKLLEALTLEARGAIEPPRIVTEAGLARELSLRPWTAASPAAVEWAWLAVLAGASAEELAPLLPRPEVPDRSGSRLSLARQLAALDRRLAALAPALPPARAGSPLAAVASLSGRVRELLESAGRIDPSRALELVRDPGARRKGVEVLLAGVVEISPALRAVLASLDPPPRAWIQATEDCAEGFDELGGLVAEFWEQRAIPLRGEDWLAVDDLAGALREATAWIQRLPEGTTTDELALGVLGPELMPGFRHAFEQHGRGLHDPRGRQVRASAPWLALDALQAWIAREDFAALASALRHPVVADCLKGSDPEPAARAGASTLDAWHDAHLPDSLAGELPGADAASEAVRGAREGLRALCGPLASREERPLPEWTAAIAGVLCRLYPEVGGESGESASSTRAGLECFADLAQELASFASVEPAARVDGAQALRLWLDWTAEQAVPGARTPGAVEALGWLELSMEEAPFLLVVGLNDGWVPQSERTDPLLGDEDVAALRRIDGTRTARDAHALTAIALQRRDAGGRKRLLALSLRRGVGADPLRPSRLLFHADESTALARAKAFYPKRDDRQPLAREQDEAPGRAPAALPLLPPRPLRAIGISKFKSFLSSPYLYYLQEVLRLERVRDDAWELDARKYGSLVHDVLEPFGRSDAKDSTDPARIERFVHEQLHALARERFGERPLPAVRLQLQQLERRLSRFALVQAREAAAGWRIDQVELELEGAALDVDGVAVSIRGRIDRIDRHADGRRWRILDYKTGDDGAKPRPAHLTRNGWRDLQLPLYGHFLREQLPGEIRLGYFALPRRLEDCGVWIAEFEPAELADAVEEARRLARRMLADDFAVAGRAKPADRVQRALLGLSLLSLDDEAAPGEDEDPDEETA